MKSLSDTKHGMDASAQRARSTRAGEFTQGAKKSRQDGGSHVNHTPPRTLVVLDLGPEKLIMTPLTFLVKSHCQNQREGCNFLGTRPQRVYGAYHFDKGSSLFPGTKSGRGKQLTLHTYLRNREKKSPWCLYTSLGARH